MSTKTRCEYLEVMQGRYRAARRLQRSRLLDEMEEITGLHRKSLIRLMYRKDLKRKPRTRQRGCTYGLEAQRVFGIIAESFDYPCAERLHGNLAWMGQHLERHRELHLTKGLLDQLERMSVSTIRRPPTFSGGPLRGGLGLSLRERP